MLQTYRLANTRLEPCDFAAAAPPSDIAWFDLHSPTPEEEARIEQHLGIEVPTREEMGEIEVSSRLYKENGALYMTASLVVGADGPNPSTDPVTFILGDGYLVTVRYSEPSVFRTFARQARADFELKSADDIFIALLEAVIDRTADILEKLGRDVDALSQGVFQDEAASQRISRDYKIALRALGRSGDLNSRVRESLVSISRLIHYAGAEGGEPHAHLRERAEGMDADIRSLGDHANSISGATGFLLNATLGLINTEQNAIIRIISVIAVVIMPPTLVASIYGMNFRFMPELNWVFGYPMALCAIILAAVLPYWFFKRRGWL
jgi:magnesium transporter